MTYSGLTIKTTVHDTNLSSHAIPAYPEYDSATTFDDAFYAERRAECDALIGAAVDYQDDPNQGGGGGGGGAVDISDATINGPATIGIGNNYTFTVDGTYESDYVNDYTVLWTVPAGQGTTWEYKSDTTDILTVLASGIAAGAGTVTCTLTDRSNSANTRTITKAITIV
jgi:hypothetical protein